MRTHYRVSAAKECHQRRRVSAGARAPSEQTECAVTRDAAAALHSAVARAPRGGEEEAQLMYAVASHVYKDNRLHKALSI